MLILKQSIEHSIDTLDKHFFFSFLKLFNATVYIYIPKIKMNIQYDLYESYLLLLLIIMLLD